MKSTNRKIHLLVTKKPMIIMGFFIGCILTMFLFRSGFFNRGIENLADI